MSGEKGTMFFLWLLLGTKLVLFSSPSLTMSSSTCAGTFKFKVFTRELNEFCTRIVSGFRESYPRHQQQTTWIVYIQSYRH